MIGGEGGAVREPEQQPAVDGAEHRLAGSRASAQPRHVLEQPFDLRRGEVRVEYEAGALADPRSRRRRRKPGTAGGGAPVLPHDCPVQWSPGLALPDTHRLALVGDPECGRDDLRLLQRLARGFERLPEDLLGIVLDLARLGEVLGDLAVAAAENPAVRGDDERGRAGRALVDGEDGGHANGGFTSPRSVT